ncbi:pyridoxamine 5'-phosphate oxidase family protein [Schaalia georgiae]|nr:pyridoxamine 5'-phosphate oxidase family protein [Schaalia georgiae]
MDGSGIDWEAAANHWLDQEAGEARMPAGDLIAEVEEFLGRHKICALATAGAGIVRNTTVEYVHAEGAFWIVSEGGLKFRALRENSNVCLAIHDDDTSFDTLAGLQVTGTAEVLEPFGAEYERACRLRGIPVERLRELPFVMNIIKVTPTRYDYVSGRLKERGFSARQHVDL